MTQHRHPQHSPPLMREDSDAVNRVDQDRLWHRHARWRRSARFRATASTAPRCRRKTSPRASLLIAWAANAASGQRRRDRQSVRAACRHRRDARAGDDRQPHGQPAARRALRRHLRRARRRSKRWKRWRKPASRRAGRSKSSRGPTRKAAVFEPCTMGSAVFTGARPLADVLEVTDNEGVELERCARARHSRQRRKRRAARIQSPAAGLHRSAHRAGSAARERRQDDRGRHRHPGPALVQRRGVRQDGARGHDAARAAQGRDARRDRDHQRAAELTRDPHDVTRFTVGRMLVTPNSPNSVASHVLFSVDIRHPDPATIAGSAMRSSRSRARPRKSAKSRSRRPCTTIPAYSMPSRRTQSRGAAQTLDLPHMRLPSGASHDAKYMARVCPTGDDLRAVRKRRSRTTKRKTPSPRISPPARAFWSRPCWSWQTAS